MTSPAQEELPRLGRYQVLCKLAQGGMAEIFLAKSLGVMGFERLVAIKLIHSNLTRDPEFVKMFIDEARIAMHLQHRNIVQVSDLDKLDDTYFIAMEYVHGVNVYDVYEAISARGRWLDTPLALYIVSEVCKGLHFAHTRHGPDGRALGIVHRDISPQNVLLSFEGEVKITDFGIAKAQERLHVTTPGIVKGKYAYMAPEVLADQPATPSVDVFAAGVLLYELLVGENPFAGATAVETIENVLNKVVEPPSARGALVQAELDFIALKALTKDPKERYRSCQELAEALTEHGLNLTQARKDMAAGDSTISMLLADLFPEKAKTIPSAADPASIVIPVLQKAKVEEEPKLSYAATPKVVEVGPPIPDHDTEESDDIDATRPRPAIDPAYRADLISTEDRPTERGFPKQSDLRPDRLEAGNEDATLLNANAGDVRAMLLDPSEDATEVPRDEPAPRRNLEPRILPVNGPTMPDPVVVREVEPFTPSRPPTRPNDRGKLLGLIGLGLAALLVAAAVFVSSARGPVTVSLPIRTTPDGATVTIDGMKQESRTPLEVVLPEGSHVITIELEGYQTERLDFLALAGVEAAVERDLKIGRGSLIVQFKPADATLYVDGSKQIGTAGGELRLDNLELEKEIVVRAEKSGFRPYEVGLSLSGSSPSRTVSIELQKSK
jgi:serine/threonine-protein kinase